MAKTTPPAGPRSSADEAPGTTLKEDSVTTGKGRPTPTRKQKEEARKRPLVSSDRTAARKASREQMAEAREKARIGMAQGVEKYLPIRDRGPQKKYVRDYVDARFSIGELMIPFMVVLIITSFFGDIMPAVTMIGFVALWGFFIVAIADVMILGIILRRKLAVKFGDDRVEKVRWYAAMRALQLRPMRLPKPQVKRGQFPV
jgi:hypothetical protein